MDDGRVVGLNLVSMLGGAEIAENEAAPGYWEEVAPQIQELLQQILPQIWKLSALQELDLSCNGLSGLIPEGILQLPVLQSLKLTGNHFSGEIPSWLGKKMSLQHLDLTDMLGTLAWHKGFTSLEQWQFNHSLDRVDVGHLTGRVAFRAVLQQHNPTCRFFSMNQSDYEYPVPRGRQILPEPVVKDDDEQWQVRVNAEELKRDKNGRKRRAAANRGPRKPLRMAFATRTVLTPDQVKYRSDQEALQDKARLLEVPALISK
jgi:hypothetical protein